MWKRAGLTWAASGACCASTATISSPVSRHLQQIAMIPITRIRKTLLDFIFAFVDQGLLGNEAIDTRPRGEVLKNTFKNAFITN